MAHQQRAEIFALPFAFFPRFCGYFFFTNVWRKTSAVCCKPGDSITSV
jgi:hypothetical protein